MKTRQSLKDKVYLITKKLTPGEIRFLRMLAYDWRNGRFYPCPRHLTARESRLYRRLAAMGLLGGLRSLTDLGQYVIQEARWIRFDI